MVGSPPESCSTSGRPSTCTSRSMARRHSSKLRCLPPGPLPDPATLPSWIRAEFVGYGGHAAFREGRWPWRVESWAERRAVEFLAALATAEDGSPAGTVC